MTPRRLRLPAASVGALAFALALSSCGGGSDDSGEPSGATTETAAASTADDFTETTGDETTATSTSGADAGAGTTVVDDPVVATEPSPGDGDGQDEGEATDPVVDTAAASDGTAPPGVTSGDDVGEAAAANSATASLVEWEIDAPVEYAAGDVTFTAQNDGDVTHELVVIEGESYESLPLADGGEVIEDELPTGALLGRTSRLSSGSTEDLTVTLAPGNYVLVCNLGGGDNSHAGKGQRLDVSVS